MYVPQRQYVGLDLKVIPPKKKEHFLNLLKFHPVGYHVMYIRKKAIKKIGVTVLVFAQHGWPL